ncbi:hypothetical protein SEA_ZIRINKA_32 [Gordonia phage Zirinka]|uniref:Uncharacterized protein n=2 Tax=Nymphadoravirus zirinka TaxID=2170042 RepID=A0A1B3B1X8_9CAUD|nr:hypothetical protein SEA_ZIRINKA_32 [Gordonia phage Zirinka]AOE45033.1 hypothetical protein SEA_ZIRINKA_32 [Gordonia phage Zirinka]AYQ99174.1 hypothetical protein PBI_BIALOTA_32 [Gordonia phage Bialota]
MTSIDSYVQEAGTIDDNVNVVDGGSLVLGGMITGTLVVHQGGNATVNGMVSHLHVLSGGSAELAGTCTGTVTNEGNLRVVGVVSGSLTTAEGAHTSIAAGAIVDGRRH